MFRLFNPIFSSFKKLFMEHYVEWGYLGLFVSSFLAATIIPLSSEIVLSILLANDYNFITSLSVTTLGNWLGGLSSYALGRLGNWNLISRYFGVEQIKVEALKNNSRLNLWRILPYCDPSYSVALLHAISC